MTYISTKTYSHSLGLSCCFRQWRAESHCKYLHGYSLEIRMEFEADELDERNWVVDFGSLKSFKDQLERTLDHKTLVAEDDPDWDMFVDMKRKGLIQMVRVENTGCEAFAKLIYECLEIWLADNGYKPRVRVRSVEVKEHPGNSAIYDNTNK